ncbi:MAG: bifunctional lysylphosphatidylglycerol flippase/synthetase MprF [Pseudomonadota bacterium]
MSPEAPPPQTNSRLRHGLAVAFGGALFVAAIWLIQRVLGAYAWDDVLSSMRSIALAPIIAALALTVGSYGLLIFYDVLALRYVGATVPWMTTAATSFAANAVGHSVGLTALSGGSIRLRMYAGAGLGTSQIAQIIVFCTLTFAFGTCLLLGGSLLLEASRAAPVLHMSESAVFAWGVVATGIAATWVLLNLLRRTPLPLLRWQLRLPGAPLALGQIVIGSIDLAITAAVLYVLLPAGAAPSFGVFLGLYLIALAAGVVSNVPGGLGVFESVLLLLLPAIPPHEALSALLAYRVIYYLLPFAIALALIATREAWVRRTGFMRATAWLRAWLRAVTPQALAAGVFLCGVVLLFSGATPAADARLHILRHIVPLSLLEMSHLIGSAAGVALLLLARGLQRRMDAAWHVTVALLIAGILASLFKGFDYEEALLLTAILVALRAAKGRFTRRAALLEETLSVPWMVAIAAALAASVALGAFSARNVEYSHELWWQFAFHASTPRVLRASVLVIVLAGAFATWKLIRPAPPELPLPDDAMLERTRAAIARSDETNANLALLGDKKLLFANEDAGFVMFQPVGKCWVAMGDPVGAPAVREQLVWEFRAACDRFAAWPVFYQVNAENLPLYLDTGFSLSKLGEEARVNLGDFGLDGPRRADLRQTHRRAQREGCSFQILQPPEVRARVEELRAISDEWLAAKSISEKGFSLGRFDPAYLANFSCAVVLIGGRIVAFANLWATSSGAELSVDLMRHSSTVSRNLMDYLFIETLLWGKTQGYRWFNLGMAPLSGMQDREFAPVWNRMAAFLYRHGEHFYNFNGLRRYKEKFEPEWRPRYLACPGGLALPRVLMEVTALIAGGTRRVFMR